MTLGPWCLCPWTHGSRAETKICKAYQDMRVCITMYVGQDRPGAWRHDVMSSLTGLLGMADQVRGCNKVKHMNSLTCSVSQTQTAPLFKTVHSNWFKISIHKTGVIVIVDLQNVYMVHSHKAYSGEKIPTTLQKQNIVRWNLWESRTRAYPHTLPGIHGRTTLHWF